MGRRGPAPKPTILKLAAGNPGKRPINMAEPIPAAGVPERPAFVVDGAAELWDQLVPRLAASGLARSIDGLVLARYCSLFDLWIRALAATRKSSTYPVKDDEGNIVDIKELPQSKQLRLINSQLLTMEREFGLTPAARTRIHVENNKTAAVDIGELKRRLFAGA